MGYQAPKPVYGNWKGSLKTSIKLLEYYTEGLKGWGSTLSNKINKLIKIFYNCLSLSNLLVFLDFKISYKTHSKAFETYKLTPLWTTYLLMAPYGPL
jgi:hypothetical protein